LKDAPNFWRSQRAVTSQLEATGVLVARGIEFEPVGVRWFLAEIVS